MKWLLYGDDLIGDTLMKTPAIRALKAARPDDTIDYLSGNDKGTFCLLEHNPYLRTVWEVPNRNEGGVCAGLDQAVAGIRGEYDRCVHLDCSQAFGWGVQNNKSLAEGFGPQLGVPVSSLKYDLIFDAQARQLGRSELETLTGGQPYAIIGRHSASCASNDPAIRVANKCVANRLWVQAANWLKEQGIVPVAVGAKDDLLDDRYSEWPGERFYGRSLPRLGGAIEAATVVVSVDTGIRHMAAALGTSLYCLSGAIPLSLIRCEPVFTEQRIVEEFRPLPFATARAIIAGIGKALGNG